MSSAPPDNQAQRIAALREQLEPLMDAPEPAEGLVEKWLKALDKKPLVYWRAYGVVLSNRSLETHRGSSLPVVTEHAEALEEAFVLIARALKDYPQFVRRRAFGRIAVALTSSPTPPGESALRYVSRCWIRYCARLIPPLTPTPSLRPSTADIRQTRARPPRYCAGSWRRNPPAP